MCNNLDSFAFVSNSGTIEPAVRLFLRSLSLFSREEIILPFSNKMIDIYYLQINYQRFSVIHILEMPTENPFKTLIPYE